MDGGDVNGRDVNGGDVAGAAVTAEQEAGRQAEPSLVKSAERTVRILEALAASPDKLSLAELQARVRYPRSSLHALVRTLRDLKWIEADAAGSRFGVGPHALLSGTAYLDRDPVLPQAQKTLEELRAEVGHTVHYARRDADSVIYLASRESTVEVRRVYRVGRRLPAHITALGQALLAELTDDEVAAVLPADLAPVTDRSIADHGRLRAELDQVRARGWAFEREQGTPDVACVACVVDYRIPASDAVSCSMPANLADDVAELERIAGAVVRHTRKLAAALRREGIR